MATPRGNSCWNAFSCPLNVEDDVDRNETKCRNFVEAGCLRTVLAALIRSKKNLRLCKCLKQTTCTRHDPHDAIATTRSATWPYE
eukprot:2114376-Amphidinium_carterae.1